MYYHLRYTPYELSSENITTFFDKFDQYIVAHEQYKKDGTTPTTPHFHCWFSSSMSRNGLRDAFKKAMCIPSGGKGVNNKYYSLEEYRNGTNIQYIIKQGKIVKHKGIDEKELEIKPEIHLEGGTLKEKNSETAGAPPPAHKEERETEWQKLMDHCIDNKYHKQNLTETAYKQIICKYYLNRLRPVPRTGDLKRYAFSLYAIFKSKMCEDEQSLNGLVAQYVDDISDKQV